MEDEEAHALGRFPHQLVFHFGEELSLVERFLPTDGHRKCILNHAMLPFSRKAVVAHEAAAVMPVTSPVAQEVSPRIPARLLSRVMIIL